MAFIIRARTDHAFALLLHVAEGRSTATLADDVVRKTAELVASACIP